VTRNPRFDSASPIKQKEWLDKYDLTPAEKFGRLVELIPAGAIPRDIGVMMRLIEKGLADFSHDDYLVAIGDPISIAMATLVAGSHTGGVLSFLKFDRVTGEYRAHLVSTGSR
jgi:hypothetical protein